MADESTNIIEVDFTPQSTGTMPSQARQLIEDLRDHPFVCIVMYEGGFKIFEKDMEDTSAFLSEALDLIVSDHEEGSTDGNE